MSRPRKYINFGSLEKGSTQNARPGTRGFETHVPNAKPYRRNMLYKYLNDGQNYLLFAIDMAQVDGPLSVVLPCCV